MEKVLISILLASLSVGYTFQGEQHLLMSKELHESVQVPSNNLMQLIADFNQHIQNQLYDLIDSSVKELSAQGFVITEKIAIYGIGSLANRTFLPCSDLEFGILLSDRTTAAVEYSQRLTAKFFEKATQAGFHFDHMGWHPQFVEKNKQYGHPAFIATSEELSGTRNRGLYSAMRYALYNPIFMWGDFNLYIDYRKKADYFSNFYRVIDSEFSKTASRVTRNSQLLRKAIRKTMQNQWLDITINFKPHLVKPIIECATYFCMQQKIFVDNPFQALDQMEKHPFLFSSDLISKIRSALIWGLRQRILSQGMDVMIKDLSNEELERCELYLDAVEKLVKCTERFS